MALKVQNGHTLLFIGDSITDCGRRDTSQPLGSGYVKLFNDLVIIRHPQKQIRVINKGISGDRVTGLRNRWHDDVLRFKPDWLSIKIGINDLHSNLLDDVNPVTPEVFATAYDDILHRTKQRLPTCKVLLIEPFYISTDRSPSSERHAVIKDLPRYTEIVRQMAKKYRTRHIRTHDIFQKILKYHPPDALCPEPVHPDTTGHLAIAEAVYNALS